MSLDEHDQPSASQIAVLDALAQRRIAREPVARILGAQEFYGLSFGLNADTLVPRPDTELLVDLAIEAFKDHPSPYILDCGTGSGCIAIALAVNLPRAKLIAIDLSAGALSQAQTNAAIHGVAGRITFMQGDWFSPLHDQRFDLIVSNPPYISPDEIKGLDADVRLHDPMLALEGGEDGLDPYRYFVGAARQFLVPDGMLLVEHGATQGQAIAQLFTLAGWRDVGWHRDLAGKDRVISVKN